MSTNQDAATLEQTLNRTDLGHVINENKKLILIIGAILVAMILGYSVFSHLKETQMQENLEAVFEVESTVFNPYIEGKVDSEAFKKSLMTVSQDVMTSANLIPSLLASLNKLENEGKLDQDILTLVQNWTNKLNKSSDLYLFVALRVSSLLEDQAQAVKAAQVLEEVRQSKNLFLQDRVHYELGRIYISLNNVERAKERLEFLTKNFEKSIYSTKAKLLLSGL